MACIGLDAGSVSVKLVVLDDNGSIHSSLYQRHKGQPLPVALEMLKTVMRDELCVTDKNEHKARSTNHGLSSTHHFQLPVQQAG